MAGYLADAFIRLATTGPDKADVVAGVKKATAGVKGSVPIFADIDSAKARIAELAGILAAMERKRTTLLTEVDDQGALAKLLTMGVAMDQLNRKIASPKISPIGLDSAIARAATLSAQLEDIGAAVVTPEVDVGGGAAGGLLGSLFASGGGARFGTAFGLGFLTWLELAHVGITLLGAQIAADAAGFTAFGIAAANAFGPIITNWSTLTTTFGTLDNYQRAAVLNIQNLMDSLQGGSEAGIFTVFSEGLSIVRDFTSGTGGLVNEATQAFQRFGAMLNTTFTGPGWQALVHGTGGIVRTDMTALFGLINEIVGVLPELIHSFNSWGLALLSIVSHGLGVLGWLSKIDQGLGNVISKVAAVLTIWSLLSKVPFIPLVGPVTLLGRGIAALGLNTLSATGAFTNFRQFGLLPTLSFMTGITSATLPMIGAFAGLGLAAAAFVIIANSLPDPVNKLVTGLQQQDKAVGDNAAGYAKLAAQLAEYTNHVKQLPTGLAARDIVGIAQAQGQAAQTARTLGANFAYLADTFGLTQRQALAVADALGINLTQALTGNSKAAQQARFEIQNYIKTQQGALSPMSQFDFDVRQISRDAGEQATQTQDLANAYAALLGPLEGVETAAGNLWPSLKTLSQAVKDDGTQVSLWSPKGADLATKLSAATTNATGLSTAIFTATGNVQNSLRPLSILVDEIEDLHLKGQLATTTVGNLVTAQAKLLTSTGLNIIATAQLISKLDHIPLSKVISILMSGKGNFTISGSEFFSPGLPGSLSAHVHSGASLATGGRVPGTGSRDSVPAWLTPGEAVVPKHLVPHVAPILAAGRVPGFASGGYVGTGPAVGAGLGNFGQGMFNSFEQNMITGMEGAMRTALVSAQRAAALAFRSGPSAFGGSQAAIAFAKALLPSYGWGNQFPALYALWERESGWNPYAVNPSSGAYGIPQALGHGHPYALGDYANQIRWGLSYIRGRYGSPGAAEAHEMAFGWYDQGGWLPPGLSMALNTTGKSEPVGGPAQTININVKVDQAIASVTPDRQLGQQIAQHITQAIKGGMKLYPVGMKPA